MWFCIPGKLKAAAGNAKTQWFRLRDDEGNHSRTIPKAGKSIPLSCLRSVENCADWLTDWASSMQYRNAPGRRSVQWRNYGGREAVAFGDSKRGGAKQPHRKYFLNNLYTSMETFVEWAKSRLPRRNKLLQFWLPTCLGITYFIACHFSFGPRAPPPKNRGRSSLLLRREPSYASGCVYAPLCRWPAGGCASPEAAKSHDLSCSPAGANHPSCKHGARAPSFA